MVRRMARVLEIVLRPSESTTTTMAGSRSDSTGSPLVPSTGSA